MNRKDLNEQPNLPSLGGEVRGSPSNSPVAPLETYAPSFTKSMEARLVWADVAGHSLLTHIT